MREASLPAGRIGPNAIIQLAAVLREQAGGAPVRRLFEAAGLPGYLDAMPSEMVPENEVRALHLALHSEFGPDCARALARAAGKRTAGYVLEHRIPRPAQWLLRHLPPRRLAMRLLLRAIERHAWTFVGSGSFVAVAGDPVRLAIAGNPLCRELSAKRPACDFYVGTFEAIFRELIDPAITVQEVACEAMGASACVFEITART